MIFNSRLIALVLFSWLLLSCSKGEATNNNSSSVTDAAKGGDIMIAGQDYQVVNEGNYKDKQPELLEFFWYG